MEFNNEINLGLSRFGKLSVLLSGYGANVLVSIKTKGWWYLHRDLVNIWEKRYIRNYIIMLIINMKCDG